MPIIHGPPKIVYVSYSHKDQEIVERICQYLKPLEDQGSIHLWRDSDVNPGEEWNEAIKTAISVANIFLLMVSPAYLASSWLQDVEMKSAMDHYSERKCRIIPIILEICDWHKQPYGKFSALPTHGKPIAEWESENLAFSAIGNAIQKVLDNGYEQIVLPPLAPIARRQANHSVVQSDNPIVSLLTVVQPEEGGETMNTISMPSGKTLIIHGHADQNRLELSDFIQNKLGLSKPVVMGETDTFGLTLPEKFERLASQVEFAIALVTPDDLGKTASETDLKSRARQNVLIEIGWFWGRLGRGRVLLLVKGRVEIPSDLQGLEYYSFADKPTECSEKIRAFFKTHGVKIN
jgi:predicted nucleotide-binding protein